MSEKVKLKREYVKLKQLGKDNEAMIVLNKIWDFNSNLKNKGLSKEMEEKSITKETKKKVVITKFKDLNSLSKIKGIGKETIKDLKSLYSNLDNLIKAIKEEKNIPLRNDIESKLRKELI